MVSMDALIFLQDKINSILPFFILLGLLIFVHELGHFLVAKFYKVRVEVFSLGFGKKILQFKKGDTVYCISLIPLGGYVKMFGDDPTKDILEDDKKYSFLHKPVGQRIAIVLAGPLMNLFFAVFLYFAIGLIGQQVPGTQLGDIKVDSVAAESGFKSGDLITSINGTPVAYWNQVKDFIEENPNKQLNFEVTRQGQKEKVTATSKLMENDFIFSTKDKVGKIPGLTLSSEAPVVAVSNKDSLAAKNGFFALTLIEEINGKKVSYHREIIPTIEESIQSGSLKFKIKKFNFEHDKAKSKTITISHNSSNASELFQKLGFEKSDLFLVKIQKDSPAKAAGIKYGDKITAINNKPMKSWEDVLNSVKSYKKGDDKIKFTIKRLNSESPLTISVEPRMTELTTAQGQEDNRYTVGIVPALSSAPPLMVEKVFSSPLKALSYGVEKSWNATKLIAIGLVRLVQGEVSSKNVGGVISIGVVASKSFEIGLTTFLNTMALISINLFLLNLLPVPILDGGHLVFFSIEALRGAPLSLRKMEIAQQIGLALLLSLMVFALFNDITNLMNSPW